jgi:hypothetical protein
LSSEEEHDLNLRHDDDDRVIAPDDQARGMARGALRPRRLRRTANLRRMVRETTIQPDDFILPRSRR